MELDIHTKSWYGLYEAQATYKDDCVTVKKGSVINIRYSSGYKPSPRVKRVLDDKEIVNKDGLVLQDITFPSLSAAASFVTGRTANGLIVWKTSDNKAVRLFINEQTK